MQSSPPHLSGQIPVLGHARRTNLLNRHHACGRFLDRTGRFHQSAGHFNIRRKGQNFFLLLKDWPHELLHWNTLNLLFLFVGIYVGLFCLFAGLYMAISDNCGLNVENYVQALYLSIETQMTIGYGVPQPYFNSCAPGMFVIGGQCLVAVIYDALVIAIVFNRILRAQRRATSIVFSNKASLRMIDDKVCLTFQVVEMQRHQTIEAHVRCYVVRHSTEYLFQTHVMRLLHPDDDLGGTIFLALPTVVVHHVDNWSPLMPPWSQQPRSHHDPMNSWRWPEPRQRSADASNGTRTGYWCLACGDQFANHQLMMAHIRYNVINDLMCGHWVGTSCPICGESFPTKNNLLLHFDQAHGDLPTSSDDEDDIEKTNHSVVLSKKVLSEQGSSLDTEDMSVRKQPASSNGSSGGKGPRKAKAKSSPPSHSLHNQTVHSNVAHFLMPDEYASPPPPQNPSLHDIVAFMKSTSAEVLVLVECIEAVTSSTLQARHSYTADDIVTDMKHAVCVFPDNRRGGAVLDFGMFHEMAPISGLEKMYPSAQSV